MRNKIASLVALVIELVGNLIVVWGILLAIGIGFTILTLPFWLVLYWIWA